VLPAASPNFAFLASHDPFLESLGAAAERNFADDPATALFKLRLLGERLAKRAAALTAVYFGPDDGGRGCWAREGRGSYDGSGEGRGEAARKEASRANKLMQLRSSESGFGFRGGTR